MVTLRQIADRIAFSARRGRDHLAGQRRIAVDGDTQTHA
jgi:hypothetical protein